MPRNYNPVEISAFSRGLVTEASPLTFPDGAASQIDNFVLNRDGTVNRRLGMEEEGTNAIIESGNLSDGSLYTQVFEWDNPGGFSNRAFLAVTGSNNIRIFDRAPSNFIGDNLLHTINIANRRTNRVSMTSVDGTLVIAYGSSIQTLDFNGRSFTLGVRGLRIRDVFGVDDGLTNGGDVADRPSTLSDTHLYNLRNQTWAALRRLGDSERVGDPIEYFALNADRNSGVFIRNIYEVVGTDPEDGDQFDFVSRVVQGGFPSNADTVNQALFSNPSAGGNRTVRRFYPDEVRDNPLGTVEAPKGHFIIDAVDRGPSRANAIRSLELDNNLRYSVDELPLDITPRGATVVQEYGGRVFYAGFSSEVFRGDSRSPRMGSYVLFSRLVRSVDDITECYQDSDPTNPDDSEPAATDGGFIRIDEVTNIVGMAVLRNSLFILAENGVWSVNTPEGGFSPQDLVVNKVTDKGVLSPTNVVVTDQSLVYWSDSGIFAIGPNEFGDYFPNNLTNTTIQRVYDSIPFDDKVNSVGIFDSYEQKLRWVYSGNRELVLDLNLNAFYTNTFNSARSVRSVFLVPPFRTQDVVETVQVNGEDVTVNGETVTTTFERRRSSLREVAYLVGEVDQGLFTNIRVARLSDESFQDWGEFDAPATMVTGQITGGDNQRYKDMPYLTLHFRRTETGFDDNFNPVGESSCLVRVAWEWANSERSNRWTRQFQGYRYRRLYLPASTDDEYDTGFETVITKNKLRGKGKALSIHFETEPAKDCHLLGWSMILGVAANV